MSSNLNDQWVRLQNLTYIPIESDVLIVNTGDNDLIVDFLRKGYFPETHGIVLQDKLEESRKELKIPLILVNNTEVRSLENTTSISIYGVDSLGNTVDLTPNLVFYNNEPVTYKGSLVFYNNS